MAIGVAEHRQPAYRTAKGSVTTPAGPKPPPYCDLLVTSTTAGNTCNTKNTWLGTARARLGAAANNFLFFVTGGAAFGNVEAGLSGGTLTTTNYNTTTKVGWTAGAGIEWAFTPNWIAKVEFLYVDLGTASCTTIVDCGSKSSIAPAVVPPNDSVKFSEGLVRLGVNFKF